MTKVQLRDMLLTALMQARLAGALYLGRSGVEALAQESKARYRYLSFGHIAAGALIFEDHVHFSVMGTDDLYDWAQNFSTKSVVIGDDEVHKGFSESAESVVKLIRGSDLPAVMHGKRLYLGGHSAGGAIAEVMAAIYSEVRPDSVYTFGSPKSMSAKTAASYHAQPWRSFRFIMPSDPVPYLPLASISWLTGRSQYAHPSRAMELREDGTVLSHDGLSTVGRFLAVFRKFYMSSLVAFMPWIKGFDGLIDVHSSHRYIAALRKAVGYPK